MSAHELVLAGVLLWVLVFFATLVWLARGVSR
jgi:hypothetical protein